MVRLSERKRTAFLFRASLQGLLRPNLKLTRRLALVASLLLLLVHSIHQKQKKHQGAEGDTRYIRFLFEETFSQQGQCLAPLSVHFSYRYEQALRLSNRGSSSSCKAGFSRSTVNGMKTIDLKSLLIGFLFATTLILAIGATSKTQDVRIVGIDKSYSDWDSIKVELSK
jgi:hypothetical protein